MYRSCVLCIVGHPVVPIAAIAIGGMYGPTTSVHLCGLHAEGPRDAKSCRGTRVATSSSMRLIAKRRAAVAWSVHAYCYCGYENNRVANV